MTQYRISIFTQSAPFCVRLSLSLPF